MLTILLIIFGLGFLIVMHEFGHFIMAKKNGVRVEAFSVGFGPVLMKKQRGETEYRLSLIPLGGYVKLSGELPTEGKTPEPHDLTAKGKWARLQIFAAGALTNIILALPLSCLSLMSGTQALEARFRMVPFNEASAGIKPGDKVTQVGEKEVRNARDYITALLSHENGKPVLVTVNRAGDKITLEVINNWKQVQGFNASNKISLIKEGAEGEKAGLQENDIIIKVNGVTTASSEQILELFNNNLGENLPVSYSRKNNVNQATMYIPSKEVFLIEQDTHLLKPVVGEATPKGPSDGILRKGDLITNVDGKDIISWHDLKESLKNKGGQEITIQFKRGSKIETARVKTFLNELNYGLIGITPDNTPEIAVVVDTSPLKSIACTDHENCMGIRQGDKLTMFGNKTGQISPLSISGIYEKQDPVRLQVKRDGEIHNFQITPEQKKIVDIEQLGIYFDINFLTISYPFFEAVQVSFKESYKYFYLTVLSLEKLISREASFSDVQGPVGIMDAMHRSAKIGFGNFLDMLVLITISLGILNLLPIPVLDGGHILLLAIEAVKGKPLSQKSIFIFQYIGLAFLLMLIIVATYNDILRVFGL